MNDFIPYNKLNLYRILNATASLKAEILFSITRKQPIYILAVFPLPFKLQKDQQHKIHYSTEFSPIHFQMG